MPHSSSITETIDHIYALNQTISPEKLSAKDIPEAILNLNTCINHLATCVSELAHKLNLERELFGGYW
jgi:hypothetical protein